MLFALYVPAIIMDLLMPVIASPQFLEKDIPSEREVVLEEFKRSFDSPNQYNFTTLQLSLLISKYNTTAQ